MALSRVVALRLSLQQAQQADSETRDRDNEIGKTKSTTFMPSPNATG